MTFHHELSHRATQGHDFVADFSPSNRDDFKHLGLPSDKLTCFNSLPLKMAIEFVDLHVKHGDVP
jgi:hypothetical protein